MKPPLPATEAERIRALHEYAILDTLEEQAYDDITRLAAHTFQTPIAMVSLVDTDRQWFKARVGLAATETPREFAFCAHAILEPSEVMIVQDATVDPRFADNPLVTGEPNIRFYAGAPLVTPTGEALGTVCVIDSSPRKPEQAMIEALRALSRQVVTLLELRHAVSELTKSVTIQEEYQRQLEAYQKQIELINAQLAEQSVTDDLTGAKNRRVLEQRLEEELVRASRTGTCVSLLLVDVDGFKGYNDDFGHLAGDDALRQVARLLQLNARPFDCVARYGGDEFAVILPNTTDEGAIVIGQRLRRAIRDASSFNRAVSISIGAATARSESKGADLILQADRALYDTKRRGRNNVTHVNQGG